MEARKKISIWIATTLLAAGIPAAATAQQSPEQLAAEQASAKSEAEHVAKSSLSPKSESLNGQIPAEAPIMEKHAEPIPGSGSVVAMETKKAAPVHAGELQTAGAEPVTFVTSRNQRVELSPHAIVEFDAQGSPRILRGAAYTESTAEADVRTAGGRIAFVGKVLLSYDHNDRSTSAFVLDGEARLENPNRREGTVRLQRYRGATLVVGDVLPQLVRQLDVGTVQSWLRDFGWPEERRQQLLQGMPGEAQVAKHELPRHLAEAKLEDYFSSIDTADEFHQPEYYDRKFDDPDKVVAEQNSKQGGMKKLSPEEAALISLPKTQIDLGFELGPQVLSSSEKMKEVASTDPNAVRRAPASAEAKPRKVAKGPKKKVEQGDPDVNAVLERLRKVRAESAPAGDRLPASVSGPAVPDPVYDYSPNF